MLSSEVNHHALSNLHTTIDSEFIPTLPGSLAAPPGWDSQIVHSNSPLTTDNVINTNDTVLNSYEEYNINNTYQTSQISSTSLDNDTGYTNTSIGNDFSYQQPSLLTAQEQRNIVNTVERQDPPPIVIQKRLPNNEVTYQQNVLLRYLQPPTPPPPGPLIIREIRPPPPPALPPIQIRERPPAPLTPPPIIIREQPPPPPLHMAAEVVEKVLSPPPQAPARVVVERYGACPPKPADVIIERWLPYKQAGERKVMIERASEFLTPVKEPNLLILHDSPHALVEKRFINEGVVRADPNSYLRQYGPDLQSSYTKSQYTHLIREATHAVPPPPSPVYNRHLSYSEKVGRAPSPYITTTWERTRGATPIPRASSYHYRQSYYDSPDYYCNRREYDRPYHYCDDYSSRYRYDYPSNYCTRSSRYDYDDYPSDYCNRYSGYDYDNYPGYYGRYRPRTPPPVYDPYCRSSSSYPLKTIRVYSEDEFRRVMCDLTDGRAPATLGSY